MPESSLGSSSYRMETDQMITRVLPIVRSIRLSAWRAARWFQLLMWSRFEKEVRPVAEGSFARAETLLLSFDSCDRKIPFASFLICAQKLTCDVQDTAATMAILGDGRRILCAILAARGVAHARSHSQCRTRSFAETWKAWVSPHNSHVIQFFFPLDFFSTLCCFSKTIIIRS